jgi:hypothetical protein
MKENDILGKGYGRYLAKVKSFDNRVWVTAFLGQWCLGASRDAACRFPTKKIAREIGKRLGKVTIETA